MSNTPKLDALVQAISTDDEGDVTITKADEKITPLVWAAVQGDVLARAVDAKRSLRFAYEHDVAALHVWWSTPAEEEDEDAL